MGPRVCIELRRRGRISRTFEPGPALVEQYFDNLDPIFALIAECENGREVDDLLEGPVCHAGFKRLN